MNRVEAFITSRMPRLACALYAIKHSGDRDYIGRAMRIDPMILKCETLGSLNPDKNLYLIRMGNRSDGFFAEYNNLLKYIAYADRFGFIPVIEYTADSLYAEEIPVDGKTNPFEYYYLQPGDIGVEECLKSRNVFKAEYVHTQTKELLSLKESDYSVSEEYISCLAKVCKSYIRYNAKTSEYLSDQIKGLGVGEKTIGVHYRGTDFKRQLKDHPKLVTLKEYIENTTKILDSGDHDRIFLATDDEEGISEFKKAFGDRVFFYEDTFRGSADTSVAFSKGGRELHRFHLGLEVIRDMETLSECGALVAGVSQVALAARINRCAKHGGYALQKILDHGVVSAGGNSTKELEEIRKQSGVDNRQSMEKN